MRTPFIFTALLFISSISSAGVLMQSFYWAAPSTAQKPWWNTVAHNSRRLSQIGITALWLPPVWKGASGGYSVGYDPFDDYDIGNKNQMGTVATKWGTRDQLQRTVAVARANGLDVYLDMNVNFRKGDPGNKQFAYKGSVGNTPGRFPKGPNDFYEQDGMFGRSLNQSSSYVVENLKAAADWVIKALGTQGLRIDYAKGTNPDFLKNYLNSGVAANQFTVVEYWDGLPAVTEFALNRLQGRVSAFDFPLRDQLKDMCMSGGLFDMRRLAHAGLVAQSPNNAVTFAENDDTDRDFPITTHKHMAYAYILMAEGYPSVYWKDYFVYGMQDTLENLIWIHEALANGGTNVRWADDDLLVFERLGNPGVIAALNDNGIASRTETVQTHYGPNVQLHDYAGIQPDVTTDDQGRARITVPPNSYVAYSVAGVTYQFPLHRASVTQEYAGAEDLDIAPAMTGDFQTVTHIYADANTPLKWEINFDKKGWNPNSKLSMRITYEGGDALGQKSYGGDVDVARGQTMAPKTGWYRLEIKVDDAPNTRFWWRQTYSAPQDLDDGGASARSPRPRPRNGGSSGSVAHPRGLSPAPVRPRLRM